MGIVLGSQTIGLEYQRLRVGAHPDVHIGGAVEGRLEPALDSVLEDAPGHCRRLAHFLRLIHPGTSNIKNLSSGLREEESLHNGLCT